MKKLFVCALFSFAVMSLYAQDYHLSSPDGFLTARITIGANVSVELSNGDEHLLNVVNIDLVAAEDRLTGMEVKRSSNRSVSKTVVPLIKEKSASYFEDYNELNMVFRSDKGLTFRLYNEGLAYRFTTSSKDSLTIINESLGIRFHEGDSIRYQSSRNFNSSYETPYEHDRLGEIELGKLCNLPLLVEKQKGSFVMISESDLYSFPGLWVQSTGNATFEGLHPPYPKTLDYSGNIYHHGQILETHDFIARVKGERSYPWRIFAVAENEEELMQNDLVYLLASPCGMDDISWIRPGVVMFDWWAKKYIYGVDFKSGINTETAKYFIDFCAAQGFRYFLFDDGWCPKDDLLSVNPELDMEEVCAYADEKGVDIMLWVIWHALERQWDEAFDQFEKWGIKGIKVDFMNRDDQKMVQFYEAVASKAAEKKMVVNFHGAYKPSGLRRKYPNVLTREALIEFEYNGWTDYVSPEHHNLLPYIRMFTGPMDYIPGTTRNSTKNSFRKSGNYPMGQGTRAHAMALFVILSSPMIMLPDSPSDYYREQECTDFLTSIPVEWDETSLLKGKIGQYTILGRRAGNQWFVGAITDWDPRSFTLNTHFLESGKYQVDIISDGINADTRAEDYKRSTMNIRKGEEMEINMVSGGGWVARFTPINDSEDDLQLQITPLPAASKIALTDLQSQPHIIVNKDWYNWCPSVLKDDDGQYHMFHTRWPKSLGFLSWLTHSEILHAVADRPEGPYKPLAVAIPPTGENRGDWFTAHNSKIKKFKNTYYLYFCQTRGDSFTKNGERKRIEMARAGYQHPLWKNEARPNQRTFIASAKSLEGPWKVSKEPIIQPEKTITTLTVNPAVCQGPDGTYFMIIKGDKPGGKGARNQALAKASEPEGPWTIQDKPVIDNLDTEDVSMWYDQARKRFYAVFHAHTFIGMMTSADGINWDKAKQYELIPKGIPFDDGTIWMPDRMERPYVLTDEKGSPIMLYVACRKGNMSANIALPLRVCNSQSE